MKRILSLILVLSLSFALVGCGNTKAAESEGPDVEVVFPISLLELSGQKVDIKQITKSVKAEGMKDVIENKDESLTYIMSKSKHDEIIGEMKTALVQTIENLQTSEEFLTIETITPNENYSQIDVAVKRAEFEQGYDGLGVMAMVFESLYYQLFNGATVDSYGTTLNLKDEATGEIFETLNYPEDFTKK